MQRMLEVWYISITCGEKPKNEAFATNDLMTYTSHALPLRANVVNIQWLRRRYQGSYCREVSSI